MIPKYELQQAIFDASGGLQIGYFDPETDVKEPGVARLCQLVIPAGFDYDDEITAVLDALRYLIADVLQDFDDLPKLTRDTQDPLP